jgi:hypothetical protein
MHIPTFILTNKATNVLLEYDVNIEMTDVSIPPEDDPEIGSKHVVGKNKNAINTR